MALATAAAREPSTSDDQTRLRESAGSASSWTWPVRAADSLWLSTSPSWGARMVTVGAPGVVGSLESPAGASMEPPPSPSLDPLLQPAAANITNTSARLPILTMTTSIAARWVRSHLPPPSASSEDDFTAWLAGLLR